MSRSDPPEYLLDLARHYLAKGHLTTAIDYAMAAARRMKELRMLDRSQPPRPNWRRMDKAQA